MGDSPKKKSADVGWWGIKLGNKTGHEEWKKKCYRNEALEERVLGNWEQKMRAKKTKKKKKIEKDPRFRGLENASKDKIFILNKVSKWLFSWNAPLAFHAHPVNLT